MSRPMNCRIPMHTLSGIFSREKCRSGDIVISFNYDTVVERLARRFGLTFRHVRGRSHESIKFLKPHGSASWPLHAAHTSLEGEPLLESLAADIAE